MSFKICAIGCGSHAKIALGPSYRKYVELHPDAELAACCASRESTAEAFREQFGFARAYADIDLMLDTEKPDAVSLCLPCEITAAISAKVLEKGYPLMLEKPPGVDPQETLALIAAAEKTKTPNMVAFNRRHTPLLKKFRQLISELPTGVQNIQYDMFRINRKDPDFSTTAIHAIDAVRSILGSDYSYVNFHYQAFPEIGETVTNIFMYAEFESGATAQINVCPVAGTVVERAVANAYGHTISMNLPVMSSTEKVGSVTHIEKKVVVGEYSGNDEGIFDGPAIFETNGFYAQFASFIDDIRNGRNPVDDIKSGLQAVEIATCIRNREKEYRKTR